MLQCPHCRRSLSAEKPQTRYDIHPEIEEMIDKMPEKQLRRDYKTTFVNGRNAEAELSRLKSQLCGFFELLKDSAGE
jgi:hypothetical protein